MTESLKDHLNALRDFLRPYEGLWKDSILQNWPSSRAFFDETWLSALARLSMEELRPLANLSVDARELSTSLFPKSLLDLVKKAETFEDASIQAKEKQALSVLDTQGLNRKKQYEIEAILPLLADEMKRSSIDRAVDIGGGMGHLARLCIKHFGWDFYTIDRDEALQDKGRFWLKRTRQFPREKLHFVLGDCSPENEALNPYFEGPTTLSLGLHTCGSLAVTQFRKSLASRVIYNFGCCFDKTKEEDRNLSSVSRSDPVPWNQSSLFLATRSRNDLSLDDFRLMRRVNVYRFALHLYFQKHFRDRGFLIAGDAPKSLYAESFETYAKDRLKKLDLPEPQNLTSFFDDPSLQKEVEEIFFAHLIRNIFARPLERVLIYDRALWLSEQGLEVTVQSVFERTISPRNLLIIARRSSSDPR